MKRALVLIGGMLVQYMPAFVITYIAAISRRDKHRQWQRTLISWEVMRSRGVSADVITCQHHHQRLRGEQEMQHAHKLCEGRRPQILQANVTAADMTTYSGTDSFCVSEQAWQGTRGQRTLKLVEQLCSWDCRHTQSREHPWQRLFEKMRSRGLLVDVIAHGVAISACSNDKQPRRPWSLENMRSQCRRGC